MSQLMAGLASIVGFIATACGGGSSPFDLDGGVDGAPRDMASGGQDPALIGAWQDSRCDSDREVDRVTYAGNNVEWTTARYFRSQDNCQTYAPYETLTVSQTYAVRGAATAPGATKIDYTIQRVTLTVVDSSKLVDYNTAAYCGLTNWAFDVAQDLTGRTCQLLSGAVVYPSAGQTFYDIYQVTPDDTSPAMLLHHGDGTTGTGTSDTTRPTAISDGYYIKQ